MKTIKKNPLDSYFDKSATPKVVKSATSKVLEIKPKPNGTGEGDSSMKHAVTTVAEATVPTPVNEPNAESDEQFFVNEPEAPLLRQTVDLPNLLVERYRNAVTALSGPPTFLNIRTMFINALTAEVKKLERKFNTGERFPDYSSQRRTHKKSRH